MAKYAKNRNYVPPSKGKTVLVQPSKDKDGVVKQDWDVYIGHGLNNKHWVWRNPNGPIHFTCPNYLQRFVTKDTEDTYIKLKTPPRFF